MHSSPVPLLEQFIHVAVISERDCIGCTKCLPACPYDAILGAAKHMHTVISSECTGCGLCVAPCPVDCIVMQPLAPLLNGQQLEARMAKAERRHHAQLARKAKEQAQQQERAQARKAALLQKRPGLVPKPNPSAD